MGTTVVNNVAPTLTASGDAATSEGSAYTLNFSATDPGQDTIAQWRIDWGDGTAVDVLDGGATAATHTWSDNTADGAPYVVTVSATDEDGTYSVQKQVQVANVAPSATIAGDDRTATEGDTVAFEAAFADAGTADTHTLAWTLFGADNTPIASGTGTTFQHTFADDGTYRVSFTATDDDGAAGSDEVVVTVANAAPLATFAQSGTADEGGAATVGFTDATDVQADLDAGLRYSFDFNNDGDFTDPGDVLDGTSPQASFTFPDSGEYAVRGRVTDKDGASTDYTTAVAVQNVGPTVAISTASTSVKKNKPISFRLDFTDASAADLQAGVVYSIDWNGDGQVDQTVSGGSGLTVSHTYRDRGTYAVRVFATDKDGGVGPAVELLIRVV